MEKFKQLSIAIFLVVFVTTIISAMMNPAVSQSGNFRVKSHLVFDKKFSGKVFVIDGDSIRVDGKEVRLFGIDAPEFKQTCFDSQNNKYPCGLISFEFLRKLAGGKIAECVYAEKDKYDRYLGKCSVDGPMGNASINEELIKNGMAVIYNFTESDEKMDALEAEAKKQKLGIWRGAFQLPKNYRKENPRRP
jgi:endonuclease YncB( thermonuclease family)